MSRRRPTPCPPRPSPEAPGSVAGRILVGIGRGPHKGINNRPLRDWQRKSGPARPRPAGPCRRRRPEP